MNENIFQKVIAIEGDTRELELGKNQIKIETKGLINPHSKMSLQGLKKPTEKH